MKHSAPECDFLHTQVIQFDLTCVHYVSSQLWDVSAEAAGWSQCYTDTRSHVITVQRFQLIRLGR